MILDAVLPLVAAAARPGALLVLGDKIICGSYETRPAVIDADPDSETPGAALWVGSRHLAVEALKGGLFRLVLHGRELTAYALSAEGRAIARDTGQTMEHLRRRVRELETDLAETLAGVDAAIEAGAAAGSALGVQGIVMETLRSARGGWVSSAVLRAAIDRESLRQPGACALVNAIRALRRRGWTIETDRIGGEGYRLTL